VPQQLGQPPMLDAVASEALRGSALASLHREDLIATGTEIHDGRKSRTSREIIKPAQSAVLFDEMIQQHDIVARRGKTVRQRSAGHRIVDPQLRLAPERRDMVLEQGREFGMVRDRQDARRQSTPPTGLRGTLGT